MHGFPRDPLAGTTVRREPNYAEEHPNQTAPPELLRGKTPDCSQSSLTQRVARMHPWPSTHHTAVQLFLMLPAIFEGFWPNDLDLLQVLSHQWVVIFGKCLIPSGLCHWQTGDSGRQLRYRPQHTLTNRKWKEMMRHLITIKTCCFLLSPNHKCSYM